MNARAFLGLQLSFVFQHAFISLRCGVSLQLLRPEQLVVTRRGVRLFAQELASIAVGEIIAEPRLQMREELSPHLAEVFFRSVLASRMFALEQFPELAIGSADSPAMRSRRRQIGRSHARRRLPAKRGPVTPFQPRECEARCVARRSGLAQPFAVHLRLCRR